MYLIFIQKYDIMLKRNSFLKGNINENDKKNPMYGLGHGDPDVRLCRLRQQQPF